jgi:D-alanine-D-alanine ligase
MKIGLTYDLRKDYLAEGFSEEQVAEFDRPDTIDAIEGCLKELGHSPDRIGNAKKLIQRLAGCERWDLVFNIAEGMHGFGREAQVPAILDVYDIPYTFSDPVVLGLSLHKPFSKRIVRDAGLRTPDFAVVNCEEDIASVKLKFPLFAKPMAEGSGKGISPASKLTNRKQLVKICMELLDRFQEPVLVEEYLPGREFTVGVIGTGCDAVAIGALEVSLRKEAEADAYGYQNKEKCEDLVTYTLAKGPEAEEACRVALGCWKALECRDAGRVDLRTDKKGRMNFIEVNPLAGLHPHHSDLPMLCAAVGIEYKELIDRIIRSAVHRAGIQKTLCRTR